ncbi:MAG: ATP-binding protein [Deltaproteobacteria bacterium]|nr:ATP-binding protein [Deltaproteobacteria bacterium]
MVAYQRILDLRASVQRKSLFLFGPRQTGKTFYLTKTFPKSPTYNLLHSQTFLRLSQRPHLLREELTAVRSLESPVIIDEIQKLPILLDEVHSLIEEKKIKFVLTGSSARKLKRGGANLLGGRATTFHLFPLVSREIPDFDLMRALNRGTLPSIYPSDDPENDLADYVGNYLKEEIKAEGLARNIENFSRFLQTASLCNAELVNFTNIGNDAQIAPRTIAEYFSILEDTLTGHTLEPYTKTKRRKAVSTAKFYFFDCGVCNLLAGRKNIKPKTELFGKSFEHFIFTELRAFLSYRRDPRPLTFWRSQTSDFEVDFLIGDEVAIEVKGSDLVTERHLTGIKALAEELKLKKKLVVSMDEKPRRMGDITILPVSYFLEMLWDGGL